jgi:hypothetical protein
MGAHSNVAFSAALELGFSRHPEKMKVRTLRTWIRNCADPLSRKEVSMPWIVYLIVISILRGAAEAGKGKRAQRPRGLCAGCAFVHMQYGATGRNAVFCTFGGGVRLVKLDVLYCTDYRDRNAPPRLVRVGFAPEIQGIEAEA